MSERKNRDAGFAGFSYQIIYQGFVPVEKILNLNPLPGNMRDGDFFIHFFLSIVILKD
jgi:hypothetical protein